MRIFRRRAAYNCDTQTSKSWMDRSSVAARLVRQVSSESPDGIALADIGCGDEKLRAALEAESVPVRYRGFDLLPQHEAVSRFDVANQDLPEIVDVAVMLGVIEYLRDPKSAFARVAKRARCLVVSHRASDLSRISWWRRRKRGWVSIMSSSQLEDALTDAGFAVRERALTGDGHTLVWLAASQHFDRSVVS